MKKLSISFAKNRAEELPDDLWGRYVLPLNYEDHNLLAFSKSTVVMGGRGSGKTVFLKYHCYPTIFSNKKQKLHQSELSSLGIYWRPDTDFAHMITSAYLESKWKVAFEGYIGLSIFSEFSKLIATFVNSNYEDDEIKNTLRELMLPDEYNSLFHLSTPIKIIDLHQVCQHLRSELNDWLNYPEGRPPITFGAKEKWLYFINFTLKKIKPFRDTVFHIFIDEFENLPEEHQVLINTWIKHSQDPLIFHIAYKKHCKVPSKTQGDEHIVVVNDYRIIDLELIYQRHFPTLAAEVIYSKINYFFNDSESVYSLSDINSLEQRNDLEYQKSVEEKVQAIFPTLSVQATVDELFKDNALVKKLEKLIQDGLNSKHSSLDFNLFINHEYKRESILNGILLNRKNISPDKLLKRFLSNDQTFYSALINNNLLGSVLFLYNTYQKKTCPYYGGFARFLLLSQSNIRHIIELCYQSIIEYETQGGEKVDMIERFSIPVDLQANAVKRTSKMQIDKISSLGNYGRDLQKIAIRLGKVFLLSQKRKSQSIAEMNQFVFKSYQLVENEDRKAETLVNECKVWGVLNEEGNTKITSEKDNSTNLYVLHPIFAPYFGISPRKKRKLDLTYEQFNAIFIANETVYQKFYNDLANDWKIEEEDSGSAIRYNTNSLLDYI